ncbi:hypothetical protein MPLA_230030 [Mesorhizobium sp. ORS 3359]|nr:hypothetical protein MPLA_230030 [Mesorhizobium sp. ORS 3359]
MPASRNTASPRVSRSRMKVSARSDLMSAGSTSDRFGARRPSRNWFQYWNSAIDPFSFISIPLRTICLLMSHRRTDRAPSDDLHAVRSRMRASIVNVCSRLGDVKVNEWFTLRAAEAPWHTKATPKRSFQQRSAALQSRVYGEQGTRPAVQGDTWTAIFLIRPCSDSPLFCWDAVAISRL